jgi:hypothetical protein
VRVELVDEQQEAVVVAGVVVEPLGAAASCGPGKSSSPRTGARLVVCKGCRGSTPALPSSSDRAPSSTGRSRAPLVGPAAEVGVVVLAAGLEQVRVVADELGRDAGRRNDRVMASSQISTRPGRHRKSSAPHRMSWRAGMHGNTVWCS